MFWSYIFHLLLNNSNVQTASFHALFRSALRLVCCENMMTRYAQMHFDAFTALRELVKIRILTVD